MPKQYPRTRWMSFIPGKRVRYYCIVLALFIIINLLNGLITYSVRNEVNHEAAIKVFTTTSTGIISEISSSPQTMLLMVPLPTCIMTPVIPAILSTHPGKGSFHVAQTTKIQIKLQYLMNNGLLVGLLICLYLPIDGRTMAHGICAE